ncbi:unnamed protein product [Vitrella brassicaformis CCMP3155]|uniref:Beta-lactamase-related domain-containing protein n=1 Tax=Vitrella brassicaformis (strain CCMP3155) TaxID=1169540 RepID=A0A0G4FMR4_VITBC|nr:unnamed protein product [Vitrella brassicaformis CCMP3155]|eukprot:CEM15538.1 unnamed protein product [Vitrella brassicaformis CCMP3155]
MLSAQSLLVKTVGANRGYGPGLMRIETLDGRLLFEGSHGTLAQRADQCTEPLSASQPFEIASTSKMMTAACVLLLAEGGRLGLDDRVADHLSEDALGGLDVERVTVRMLLNHTSKLPEYWASKQFIRVFEADEHREWSPLEVLPYAAALPAKTKRFYYADTNYVLLGLLIEKIENRPLEQVLRERLFVPLGMTHTWTAYREPPRCELCVCHRYEGKDDIWGQRRQTAEWAGGGVISTCEDLCRFVRGLFTGGVFGNESTLAAMRECGPTANYFDTTDITYGLGVMSTVLDDGLGHLVGHTGHGNSFAVLWPEGGLVFAGTLNNTENDFVELIWNVLDAMRKHKIIVRAKRAGK